MIGRNGASFGQVHFAEDDFWPHNTGLDVTDFKGNDPRFAFYFLKALDSDRFNSGSAQPSLSIAHPPAAFQHSEGGHTSRRRLSRLRHSRHRNDRPPSAHQTRGVYWRWRFVIPPRALIQAFTDLAKPMFDRINRDTEQSRTLSALRDTLLPKLLSGKLSVAELRDSIRSALRSNTRS